jgi:hypothetical protein
MGNSQVLPDDNDAVWVRRTIQSLFKCADRGGKVASILRENALMVDVVGFLLPQFRSGLLGDWRWVGFDELGAAFS